MSVVTRANLHEMVWQTPMRDLAVEFGISDRGLAKICVRYAIPRPSKGYWANLKAGKPVKKLALPPCPDGLTDAITIKPAQPAKERVADQIERIPAASVELPAFAIPQTLRNLHWIVAGWVNDHQADQQKWRAENRARPEASSRVRDPSPDLTAQDRYRFQVTSALLNGLEANGCRAVQGDIQGKLLIETPGGQLEITVAELTRKVESGAEDQHDGWTAFRHLQNRSLAPTGFLRFTITTYFGHGVKKKWVETEKAKAEVLLPQIVAGVLNAGAALRVLAERREEWRRQHEAEEQDRAERRRIAQLETDRLERFRKKAADWEEAQRLRAFLSAAEAGRDRLAPEIDGMATSDWLAWARRQINDLDPLGDGSAAT